MADGSFWFENEFHAGSPPAGAGLSTPRNHRMQFPSLTLPSSVNPPSSSRQRLKPKGILFGTWTRFGLRADQTRNVVYGSRDIFNRINRRVAKVDVE